MRSSRERRAVTAREEREEGSRLCAGRRLDHQLDQCGSGGGSSQGRIRRVEEERRRSRAFEGEAQERGEQEETKTKLKSVKRGRCQKVKEKEKEEKERCRGRGESRGRWKASSSFISEGGQGLVRRDRAGFSREDPEESDQEGKAVYPPERKEEGFKQFVVIEDYQLQSRSRGGTSRRAVLGEQQGKGDFRTVPRNPLLSVDDGDEGGASN